MAPHVVRGGIQEAHGRTFHPAWLRCPSNTFLLRRACPVRRRRRLLLCGGNPLHVAERPPGRFARLLKVAPAEPPRVRAMLGAIGQQIGQPESVLAPLRESLNPLSRFEFGILAALTYARRWQAKERPDHEAV